MIIVLILILAVGALLTCLWVFNTMLSTYCPHCKQESDSKELVIPVVPLVLFWCPACNSIVRYKDIGRVSAARKGDDAPPLR